MEIIKRYYDKILLIIVLTIFFYGFICRILNIYFFWESKYISIFVFCAILIVFAIKELCNKLTISPFLVIILASTILFLEAKEYLVDGTIVNISKSYVLNNSEIQDEVGNIKEITMVRQVSPMDGDFQIEMLVKGEKKYKDITTFLFYKDGQEKKNENLFVWRHD